MTMRITPVSGAFISFGTLLLIWYLATLGQAETDLFPQPRDVVTAFVEVLNNGYLGTSIAQSIVISLQRLLLGWAICLALGASLGFAMYTSPFTKDAMSPWLAFYRPLPPLAYLSLLVLWLGVGETSKVSLLILAGLPPMMIGTHTALASVRQERVEALRSLGAGKWQALVHLYLPTALPGMIVSARIAFGACFAALIGAEMIASSSGIAWMVIAATNRGAVDVAVVGVLLMSMIALIVDFGLRRIQTIIVPWASHES